MSFRHPFRWIEPAAQVRVFAVLTVLALLVMAAMQLINAPLRTAAAPTGIIAFELAGSVPRAEEMLASWTSQAQVYAGLSLGLDYLFMPLYAGAIGLGCALVARALCRRLPDLPSPAHRGEACPPSLIVRLGLLLAWGQLVAMVLDGVENYALIRLLISHTLGIGYAQSAMPILARACAIPKFILIVAGLAYMLGGALLAAVYRSRHELQPAR